MWLEKIPILLRSRIRFDLGYQFANQGEWEGKTIVSKKAFSQMEDSLVSGKDKVLCMENLNVYTAILRRAKSMPLLIPRIA